MTEEVVARNYFFYLTAAFQEKPLYCFLGANVIVKPSNPRLISWNKAYVKVTQGHPSVLCDLNLPYLGIGFGTVQIVSCYCIPGGSHS